MNKLLIKLVDKGCNCFLFHRWRSDLDTGITRYQRCLDCNAKRIIQCGEGYQPIEVEYLRLP